MPNKPNDELDGIMKPSGSGDTAPAPSSQKPAQAQPQPGSPAVPGMGAPTPQQRPPTARPTPGVPASQQRPRQAKPTPGAPAPQQRQLPAGRPQSGPPAPQQRRPPAPQQRQPPAGPVSPATPSDARDVRTYNISPGGKLTKRPETEQELDTGSDKFKVNFDFDGAYKDVPEDRPLRVRREKRTGCVGGILYAAFVICISLVLASVMWMATVDVLGFGAEDEPVNVEVLEGFVIDDITEMLFDAGLIRYRSLFNLYADFSDAEEKISPGFYVLNKNYDYRALVQGMTARAGVRVETTVTIPEGLTLAQIFALLEDYGVCPANDLWEAATNHHFNFHFLDEETLGDRLRLEGFLFPETYNFFLDSTPTQTINRMLREFNRRFTEEYIERAEEMGYSIHDIINVAAMIEREAGNDEERPRIAAVIYNRLENPRDFPRLEIDATIHYAIAGTDRVFSTDLDSPFNTYIHEGLPPGPIANPGMASIRAALYPDETNEYFYALNREGSHNFFRTYAQHRAFVNSDEYGG